MSQSSVEKEFAKADKKILVDVVKLTQRNGLEGIHGGWKEFLNHYDRKFGSGMSDPSKRSVDVLSAFLKTFSDDKNLKIFSNFLRRRRNMEAVLRRIRACDEHLTPLQRLVHLTIEHPMYMRRFTIPSDNEDWVVIPLGKISKAMRCNVIIAVDCEMVLCEDGTEGLVQVCAVDQKLEVKVNMIVKPNKSIIDYRTEITGLTPKDIDRTTYSLLDAQKSLKKLLLHGAILAGHGLYNDLQALKIDHARVIDTSHIFRYADSDSITPSLKDLCKSVLGYELRLEGEPHNCLLDAQAVMKLVLAKLERDSDGPVAISIAQVPETHYRKLLLHKIPLEVPYIELQRLFSGKFKFDLQGELKRSGKSYSTFIHFKDPEEAKLAFQEVEGPVEKDTSGRPQKLLSLQLSSGQTINFYIRCGALDGSLPMHETLDENPCEEDKIEEDLLVVSKGCIEEGMERMVASSKKCMELEHEDDSWRKRKHLDSKSGRCRKKQRKSGKSGSCRKKQRKSADF